MNEQGRSLFSRRDLMRASAATAALATAGASRPRRSRAQGEPLTYWMRDSGETIILPIIDLWNSTHETQIEATVTPAAQFVQRFAAAVAGGQAPDLIAVDLIYMPAFSAAGEMTDITELAQSLPFYDTLSPPHMRLGTYEDRIYSLPFSADGSFLAYNRNLYEQAGLDPDAPPTTWGEISENAAAITASGDDVYGFYFSGSCPGCNAFTLLPYIWASGGDVLSEDGSEATIASDPTVPAMLEFVRGMWMNGDVPPGAQVDTGTEFLNVFAGGTVGQIGTGTGSIAELLNSYPDVEFGVTPLPGQEGGQSAFAGGDTIAIPAGTERVEEAFEFMTWYFSEEVQIEHIAANNGLPLRTDLVENQYSEEDPRYITVANAMYEGRTPYSLAYNQLFNDSNSPWLVMLQRAIFDGQMEEAVAEAQEAFTAIIEGAS
jgi:multiple sugar transport system substrate-binding protein